MYICNKKLLYIASKIGGWITKKEKSGKIVANQRF